MPTTTSFPVSLPFPPPLIARAHTTGLPKIDQGTALIADDKLVEPNEIVAGLLHAATKGVLASGSKAGKTWVMLDLASSVATGTPFLKWPTTQGKVLVVNLEIHRAFMKRRLEVLKQQKNLDNLDNLRIWNLRGHTSSIDELVDAIIAEVRGEQYSLIILDPIYKMLAGRSENMAAGVGAMVQSIDRLLEKTGAAVVYAHHFTKGNAAKKKAMDRMSGSGVFARDADTIITLTEHEEEGCYAVEMTLRNLPPQPAFVVEWDFPLMVERPDLNPKDLKREEAEEEDDLEPLLGLLDEKPLTTGDWQKAAEAEGYSRPTFFRKKKKLEDGKRVKFDLKQKTWARGNGADGVAVAPVEANLSAVQGETSETIETPETSQETTETPNATQGTKIQQLSVLENITTPST